MGQLGSERKIAEAGYSRFVRDGIGVEPISNSVKAESVFGNDDFVDSFCEYMRGKKQIPEITKRQRFMNKSPLRDILRWKVPGDRQKRNRSIGKAVLEHGYAQREVADHLRIHFTLLLSAEFQEQKRKC